MSIERAPHHAIEEHEHEVVHHQGVRARQRATRGRMALNLTAMIDVTFLLLIYFMVATEFKVAEQVYQLDLPSRLQSDQHRDPFELEDRPLRIEVASIGDLGRYAIRLDGPYPPVDSFEDLYDFLRNRQIHPDTPGGLFPVDHPIIVAPARTARWEHAIDAFNAAIRARYTNIKFSKPI